MMIPNIWRIVAQRENGGWKIQAMKQEGNRQINISTYDEPKENFDDAMLLLEERIKS